MHLLLHHPFIDSFENFSPLTLRLYHSNEKKPKTPIQDQFILLLLLVAISSVPSSSCASQVKYATLVAKLIKPEKSRRACVRLHTFFVRWDENREEVVTVD